MNDVTSRAQCPECLDSGADNLAIYEDGGAYCFGCGYYEKAGEQEEIRVTETKPKSIAPIVEGGVYNAIKKRGLTKEACEKLGISVKLYTGKMVKMGHVEKLPVLIFEQKDDAGNIVNQKVRSLEDSRACFCTGEKGANTELFGQSAFSPTDKFPITITEGEIDAASIYQATGYACVSIRSGANSAKKNLQANIEWLSKWKHVILAFDNDEVGKKAVEDCLPLFEESRVKVARMPLKDANEMLMAGRGSEIKKILWDAGETGGDNVITFDQISVDEIQELATEGASLPFPILDKLLGGLKAKRLYTLAAREKCGKTSVTKEMALHLSTQGKKVGLLYLEGDALREAISFVAMQDNVPMWQLEEKLTDPNKAKEIHDKLQAFRDSGLYIYNHKGAIDLKSVYSKIVYMVKGLECDYIILDNISIALAGNDAGTNERREIDQMVYKLVSLINNTGCTILNVVHLVKNRKDKEGNDSETVSRSDVHGSGAFAKFSHGLIGLERDSDSNRVKLKVLANRDKGTEGYADTLTYDESTGRLKVTEEEEPTDEGEEII